MKLKPAHIFTALFFASLCIGPHFLHEGLKTEPKVFLLALGLATIASYYSNGHVKTTVPFYLLLGITLYINIFVAANTWTNMVNHDDGWSVMANGERGRVMQMNWVNGVLAGLVLSPIIVFIYHKLSGRNRELEIVFAAIFTIAAGIALITR